MSTRSWTCMGCGWTGTTHDAAYTGAGAKRCPECRSGALVLSDPEREQRNAEGVAKRINGERERKLAREAPLLAHAGIERVAHVDVDDVLARREAAERESARWQQQHDRHNAAMEAKGNAIRAEIAHRLDPELLASLDTRLRGLPGGAYVAEWWRSVKERLEDGRLAQEEAEERRNGELARRWRERTLAIATPEKIAACEAFLAMKPSAGTNALIYWRARYREAAGLPFLSMRGSRRDDDNVVHLVVVPKRACELVRAIREDCRRDAIRPGQLALFSSEVP